MNEYLVLAADITPYATLKDEGDLHAYADTGAHEGRRVLALLNPTATIQPGDDLIGGWDRAGNPVTAINQTLYEGIRPFGNAKDGSATKHLLYAYWDGQRQRALGDGQSTHLYQRLYPVDNQPFPIRIAHKYFSGHDDPNHDGWGWRAEMDKEFVPTTRDPAGYFIAIYTDPRCSVDDFWYQAGSFSQMESDWQTDEEGNPATVWACEYDQAYLGSPDKTPIHHGVCKGSIHIQEGYGTLTLEEDADEYLFWEGVQGGGGGGEAWVDTGATVAAQYGTVYLISDADVCAGLVAGQAIRFTETGEETTFTGLRPGFADQILIDPFVQAAVGDALWSFQ